METAAMSSEREAYDELSAYTKDPTVGELSPQSQWQPHIWMLLLTAEYRSSEAGQVTVDREPFLYIPMTTGSSPEQFTMPPESTLKVTDGLAPGGPAPQVSATSPSIASNFPSKRFLAAASSCSN